MYRYKVKISIRKDSRFYDVCCANVAKLIEVSDLVFLGKDEYGSNSFADSMSVVQILGKQPWFLDDAEALVWYNGEDLDVIGDYWEEDSLDYFLKKRRCM